MTRDELIEKNRQRPFPPFRIHLRDGRSFLIDRPRQILVGHQSIVIGIPPARSTKSIFESSATVQMADIVRLEPLEQGQSPIQQTGS